MRLLWIFFAGLLIAGCSGEDWQAKTMKTTGYVTVNNQIPAGAIIRLHPVNKNVDKRASRPSGIVADDGRYTLTTYEYGDGAPPGDYVFTIYWPQKPELGGLSPDRLGNVYATPKTSKKTVTITEQGTPIQPINIEDAKIIEPGEQQKGGKGTNRLPIGPGMKKR
ncbi:hypothetical protein [uncultured Gimesia sp.]|uniref:hypothetical protein n=1 Tax=uncultured Gimesia sp. TaxID=1678688 RepID=UPI0030D877D2|tara:strand:- start:61861 stop:62355 length:495 start_codon:yes stop_codon:yes gene_type:complete